MTDGRTPTRGFDIFVFALPVICAGGLAVLAFGAPTWAIAGACGAVFVGALAALATARLTIRSLPGWIFTVGLGVAAFASVSAGRFPENVDIIPVAFLATVVSAGLLLRRQQLRQT